VSDWWLVFLSLIAGGLIGLVYFGGLWVTVQRLATSKRPALLALGSFLLRSFVVISVFYLVMDGRLERLAALMIGFFIARRVLLTRLRPERAG
jgi:F1F0 ATPase subunit 2